MSSATPINLAKHDNSPEAISAAVDYAIMVAGGFEMWWQGNGPAAIKQVEHPFAGLHVLEVGPGETLGPAVLLACGGAIVSVADRFCVPWDPDFHAPFYLALRERVAGRGAAYIAPIDRLLAAGTFVAGVVRVHALAAEELWKIGERFDVVLSNAVLEHVQDIDMTAANLAAVSKPGGYGFHQIDFRDHRDFSRPLEHLTISRAEFDTMRQRRFCEGGGQWRVSTVAAAFERAGFSQSASPNMYADASYLADVRLRLHDDFASLSGEDLSAVSALHVVQRLPVATPPDMQDDASE
jgi:SAM-dependent methyltransferase